MIAAISDKGCSCQIKTQNNQRRIKILRQRSRNQYRQQSQRITYGIVIQRRQNICAIANTHIPHRNTEFMFHKQAMQNLTQIFAVVYQRIKVLIYSVKLPYHRFAADCKPAKHKSSGNQKPKGVSEICSFSCFCFITHAISFLSFLPEIGLSQTFRWLIFLLLSETCKNKYNDRYHIWQCLENLLCTSSKSWNVQIQNI